MSIGNLAVDLLRGPLGGQGGQGAPPPSGGPPTAPGAAPGAPGGPSSGAPSPSTQSPQDLAQLYIQLENRARAADGINHGLALMAAANSTPSMARAIMGSVPQQQDPGSQLQMLMQLQNQQRMQQGYGQLLNPQSLAQISQRTGIPASTLQGIGMTNPDNLVKIIEQYSGVGGAPDQQDYFRALGQLRMAHPDMSDQQLIATHPWMANATSFNKITGDSAEAKANAMESFPRLSQTASDTEARANWLADPTNRQAVQDAILNPTITSPNVAKWKGVIPSGILPAAVNDQTLQARNYIDWMKANLQTQEFAGTKNVRSVTEFNNLGATATMLDKSTNDPATVADELDRLQTNSWRASANLNAEAGKTVAPKYAGMADSNYFNPENPFYNGATEGQLKPPPQSLVQQAKEGIAQNPLNRRSIIFQFREMGYDPSGL